MARILAFQAQKLAHKNPGKHFIQHNCPKGTDGIIAIHKDKIAFENYSGGLDENTKHAAMTMTKPLTGL